MNIKKQICEIVYGATIIIFTIIGMLIFIEGVGDVIKTDNHLVLVVILFGIFLYTWDQHKK